MKFLTVLGVAVVFIISVSATDNIVTVTADGAGKDLLQAIEVAKSNAVIKAVGMVMTEYTEIKDDKVRQDIYSASAGFVVSYDMVGSPVTEGEFTKVTVTAKVYADKLKKTVTPFVSQVTKFGDGKSAEPQTDMRSRKEKTTDLVSAELMEFYKLVSVHPVGKEVGNRGETPVVYVNFDVRFDVRGYRTQLSKFTTVLKRLGFRDGRGSRQNEYTVSYHKTPGDSKTSTSLKLSHMYIDGKAIRERFLFNDLFCIFELLDKDGEVLASGKSRIEMEWSAGGRGIFVFNQAYCTIHASGFPFKRHVVIDGFTVAEDAFKVDSVRTTLEIEDLRKHRGPRVGRDYYSSK